MEYNQQFIDKLRVVMLPNTRLEVSKRTNLPYSTVCDALTIYREGGRKRYKNRKKKIYATTVDYLKEKGLTQVLIDKGIIAH